jgi:hypothetical protein
MSDIKQGIMALAKSFTKNSPTILTGLGAAGVVVTAVLAVKATPKAIQLINEKKEKVYLEETREITTSEKAQAAWMCYVPTVIMGVATITCIISANKINMRRNAAIVSLFSITQSAMETYQKKVVEQLGAKKETLLRGDIAQDQLNAHPVDGQTVIFSKGGTTLFFDAFSGRYFKSDMETINKALNEFNRRLLIEDYLNINELYDDWGLEPIKGGEWMGWQVDKGLVEIRISAKVATNGEPCLVIDYSLEPVHI